MHITRILNKNIYFKRKCLPATQQQPKKYVYAFILWLAEKPAANLFKPAINKKNYGLGVC